MPLNTARFLMALVAVCFILAAIASAQSQSLVLERIEPGMNRIFWYTRSIVATVVALAIAYAALRPGRASAILLMALAPIVIIVPMLVVPYHPKLRLELMPCATTLSLVGLALLRITQQSDQQQHPIR